MNKVRHTCLDNSTIRPYTVYMLSLSLNNELGIVFELVGNVDSK